MTERYVLLAVALATMAVWLVLWADELRGALRAVGRLVRRWDITVESGRRVFDPAIRWGRWEPTTETPVEYWRVTAVHRPTGDVGVHDHPELGVAVFHAKENALRSRRDEEEAQRRYGWRP